MTKISIFKASTAPLALGLALAASPALAQDEATDAGADTSTTSSAIIVTGSRIARPNVESASPVTSVDAEQIQLTGTVSLESLLNELPQLIPGNTRVSNNSGGENFATLDLRGLGPGRTLILLDGERLPASTTTGVVDISQIPTGLIKRVEVVTGGASAVYGSDAMAGVINFILRDDFEGVELTSQYSVSEVGVGERYSITGMVGGNFADGRGNITLYGSWNDRNAVSQGRFDYSRTSAALFFDPNVDVGVGGTVVVADDPSDIPAGYAALAAGGSATAPWGTINNNAANPFQNLSTLLPNTFGAGNTDTNCDGVPGGAVNGGTLSFNDAGALSPNNGAGACLIPIRANGSTRYNFAPDNFLIIPNDRLTFTATGRYEFSEKSRLNVYASFTNSNTQVSLAPTPATGIVVPVDSPLIPADLAIALASRADPTADFVMNRRFSETGPRIGDFTSDAKTLRAIFDHDLNDNWKVNVIGSFGRVDNKVQNQGNIRRSAVIQGLNNCPNGSGPGCVPIDIFGANTLTPDMVSFVALTTTDTESFEQLRFATNITGSAFELPGGPVGIAAGFEYRKDTGVTQVDDAKRTGDIIGFNAQGSIAGSIDVTEFYGEIRLPILDMLAIGAGARYSDYSSVGGLFNWKAEAEFTPLDWVKVRGTYNRAARAPNVFELFRNGDQGFPAFQDPCNSNNPVRNDASCLAAGVPAIVLPTFQQSNSQVQTFAFGNPNLTEEKAETWTAGVVLGPRNFGAVNMSFTADYYNIKLTNRVAAQGAGFFLSQCHSAGIQSACDRILRDPTSGQVDFVNTTVVNSDVPLTTAGIDVGFDASFDALGGQIYLNDVLTYVDKYKIGDSEFVDTAFSGNGGVTVRWANTLTTGWRNETITAQVRYVWKKGGKQNFEGAELEGFFPDSARIPDLNLINLSLRVRATENIEITGIVDNLLDKFPPQTATGFFEQANTNINFFDPYALGRSYTVQARLRF